MLKYLNRHYNYWTKRGLNGPKPYPLVGNSLSTLFKPLPSVELEYFEKYGRLYGVFNGNKPILTVAEPEIIKSILVKDFHLFADRRVRPFDHKIIDKNLFN
ncbi:unnamed protein product, partial [Medioppia subpectinata]